MTGYLTPDQAENFYCPLNPTSECSSDHCILWRWRPRDLGQKPYVQALKKEITRLGEEDAKRTGKKPKARIAYHKKATENVLSDPASHGLPTTPEMGWCGLAGEPR
jgi:hypothetical protein